MKYLIDIYLKKLLVEELLVFFPKFSKNTNNLNVFQPIFFNYTIPKYENVSKCLVYQKNVEMETEKE